VGGKAVACLKASDAFGQRIVVRSGGFVGGVIAAHEETPAQQIVMRSGRAKHEFGIGGYRRPSAAHRDIRIAQCCFPDPLRGALVIGRLVRQRQRRRGT
jgi:hypothetical protein